MSLVLLDTTFLIDAERDGIELDAAIDDEDDVAVAAVSVAQILVGVELASANIVQEEKLSSVMSFPRPVRPFCGMRTRQAPRSREAGRTTTWSPRPDHRRDGPGYESEGYHSGS